MDAMILSKGSLVRGKIVLVNVRGYEGRQREGIWYIGRGCHGWKGSGLRNDFVIGKDGDRKQVIEKYRVWLNEIVRKVLHHEKLSVREMEAWFELKEIKEKVENGEIIRLGCWCYPEKCHGEIIRRGVLYLMGAYERRWLA